MEEEARKKDEHFRRRVVTLLAAIAISPEIANGEQFLRLFPKKQSIHFCRNTQKIDRLFWSE